MCSLVIPKLLNEMKPHYLCSNIDCERIREGLTPFCSSCNHAQRKGERQAEKAASKVKKPIKKVSKKRQTELVAYNKEVKLFLIGKKCAWPGCNAKATENHHARGRENELLFVREWWTPSCNFHHTYATEHSKEAIEAGFSLPRNQKI